jgi:hypothetical protein
MNILVVYFFYSFGSDNHIIYRALIYNYCHIQIPLRHLIFLGYTEIGGGGQSRSRVHGMGTVM